MHAQAQPALLDSGNTAQLIAIAARVGVLAPARARALADAHADLLGRSLACTLDARPRLAPLDAVLAAHTTAVLAAAAEAGLGFA